MGLIALGDSGASGDPCWKKRPKRIVESDGGSEGRDLQSDS